jgi:hypothetical protein
MPKYLISWTEESWYEVDIVADSKEEALDIFHLNEYDREGIINIGWEMQDSVEIEEM